MSATSSAHETSTSINHGGNSNDGDGNNTGVGNNGGTNNGGTNNGGGIVPITSAPIDGGASLLLS